MLRCKVCNKGFISQIVVGYLAETEILKGSSVMQVENALHKQKIEEVEPSYFIIKTEDTCTVCQNKRVIHETIVKRNIILE